MTKSFQPCPALPFFDMSTSTAERRYKRLVLPDNIPNELHAKQLESIEHNLWVLCDYFKVFPAEKEQKPEEKPPEQKALMERELAEIMTAHDPDQQMQKVVERALQSDADQLLKTLQAKRQDQLMKVFELGRLAQIAQEAEQAQAKVPLAQFDHSYSVLTEIRTSIITVAITEDATATTTIRDQYGVPWQLRLRKDMEWLIVDVDTSQCRGVMGQFKLLVRLLHESPLKNFSCSVPTFEVNRSRTVYCGTLGSVPQLIEDGYFAADGNLKLRVAMVPMNPDAERSSLTIGKRLKQIPADHNAHRMPKFAEGQLTIPDFLNSRTTQSPLLLDGKKATWQLEIRLNQGANEHERKHMAISIRQCDSGPEPPAAIPSDVCHEYFVELLTVDANGWTLRSSGRMLAGFVSIPNFLLKSRAEIYLKDGMLRLRWGVRPIPVR